LAIKYEVYGAQKDAAGAEALAAKDKHEFERWIVGAIEGQPYGGGKIRRAWTRAIYR
jgi:site-specific DNA-methyltransferase (adenine-specific)